jgi:hypothetical protein
MAPRGRVGECIGTPHHEAKFDPGRELVQWKRAVDEFPLLAKVLNSPQDHLEELRRVPAVDVDGSPPVSVERLQLLVAGIPEGFASVLEPLNEVGFADLVDTRLILGHEMRKRRGASVTVPRPVPVGEQDEGDTAWTQHPVDLTEKPDGLRKVLQHVASDNEILTAVSDGREPIGVEVGNHIGLPELAVRRELRE